MRASVLSHIISRFDDIAVDEGVRQQLKAMVRQVGQAHGYSMADRSERVMFARQLLDRHISRTTIRDRMMAHFDISKSQAYREIGQALQLSQIRPGFGTPSRSNTTIEIHSGVTSEEENRSQPDDQRHAAGVGHNEDAVGRAVDAGRGCDVV